MFKNCTIYRIEFTEPTILSEIDFLPFEPCGPMQERSVGWTPPRSEAHGALIEFVNSQAIMELTIETKTVPAQAIDKRLDELVDSIEKTTGRKPGKKERRNLIDDIRLELLPAAFPKRSAIGVWIDRAAGLLTIGTATQSKADLVLTELVNSMPGLQVALLQTTTSPAGFMTNLLADEHRQGPDFFVGAECELAASDETKAKIRFTNCDLETQEVRDHILHGKRPTKLALSWRGRVSFVLTDSGTLRKLKFMDVVFESGKAREAGFDADVAIATGELVPLIGCLIAALGGEPEGDK